MSSRFRFHGYAIGVAGQITQPFLETIEVQAATVLPAIGGRGTARVADFERRDLLRFHLAESEVSGSDCDCKTGEWSAATHLKASVEGLNIMGMVTADRIVANLVSTYSPAVGQNSVRLLGTRFENLRIAGIPVKVDLATDLFDKYDTHSTLCGAYKDNDDVRNLMDRAAMRHSSDVPAKIQRWLPSGGSAGQMPERLSLVRSLVPETGGLDAWGHIIHVPGFGTIRLAELDLSPATRVINMLQIRFDCPFKGRMMCLSVGDGGEPNGE